MKRTIPVAVAGAALVGALIGAAATPAHAQEPGEEPARLFLGGDVLYGNPVGPFGELVDDGFGLAGHLIYRVDRGGWLGLRADAGFLNYGRETQEVCFSTTVGCRVRLDLTTENNVFFAGIGPQLLVPAGGVRPYLNGSIGLAYFATTSSVRGDDDGDAFADDTNFDDWTFAWTGGGGLYIPIRDGPRPISVDLGAVYHQNGEAEFLREGDIIDHPDGSITLRPNRAEADLWTFRLGISIGLGSGAGPEG